MTTMSDAAVRYGPVLECKASSDGWGLEGYASTYDEDLQGDVVVPGAFRDSLARNPRPPLLWSHLQSDVIGVAQELRETPRGLWGRWKLSKTSKSADVRQLLLDKAVAGLSIGFITGKAQPGPGGVRELHQIALHEVSVVAVGANPHALVTGVKARGYGRGGELHARLVATRRRLQEQGIVAPEGSWDLAGRLAAMRGRLVKAGVLDPETEALRDRLGVLRARLERVGRR